MRFPPNTLGNLIYRTRLKLAASMLPFDGYDDFEDYLSASARFAVCGCANVLSLTLVSPRSCQRWRDHRSPCR
jgi:hypothetical protein